MVHNLFDEKFVTTFLLKLYENKKNFTSHSIIFPRAVEANSNLFSEEQRNKAAAESVTSGLLQIAFGTRRQKNLHQKNPNCYAVFLTLLFNLC